MDFEKFVSLLERRALYFASLKILPDPFEGVPVRKHVEFTRQLPPGLSEQEVAKRNKQIQSSERSRKAIRANFYVSCWHMNRDENYSMWKIYAGAGAGIAICSTSERFKAALPQVPHPSVSAGTVKYVEYDTCEPAPFAEERAFMKRRCFVFENEFRGFIHDYRAKTPGVEVPVDINILVERVYVSPLSPTWVLELVKAVGARYDLKVEVVQSEIMTGPSYIFDEPESP